MSALTRSLRRSAASGTVAWARRELAFRPLWALLAAAIALRAAAMALYYPAVQQFPDPVRFVRAPGWDGMFSDYWMPAGYAFFLRGLRLVSEQVWPAIAVQHLLGVAAGLALYLAMRRLQIPRWVALVPAAVYLLSGDVLYLEHLLMTDQQALALTVLALCAAVFGLHPGIDLRYLGLAGALAGAAWITRSPSLAVALVIVAAAAVVASGGVRSRWRAALVAAAGTALVLGAYLLAYQLNDGSPKYLGLSDMRGWDLHARVAPFADCDEFRVPEESRALCESTPPSERQGPYHYVWDPASEPVRAFTLGPQTDDALWGFAVAAIKGQPLEYTKAVVSDIARYVSDPRPTRRRDGLSHDVLSFGYRNELNEGFNRAWIEPVYDGTQVSAPGKDVLASYQDVFRVHGVLIVILLALAAAGLALGRGPARLAVALFGSTSLLLFLIPTATLGYDFRYGVPPATLLACAGTIGAYLLWARRTGRGAGEEPLSA